MSKFTRPAYLKFPQIYSTFKALNKAGDAEIEYQIRDLPEDLFEKAMEILMKEFVPEETICVACDLKNNKPACDDSYMIWYETLLERFSVGCFTNDGSDELAGVTIMTVPTLNFDPFENMQFNENISKEMLKLFDFTLNAEKVYEKYNVDKYLTDYGICIRKEFRNRGIALEFIKSRTQMMKMLNIQVTSTSYTVIATQKAAIKAGHFESYSILYKELQQKFPSFDFSKSNADMYKVMDFKI
ncbi:hypothetical protein PVAND_013687 [Polypedilum vanderplanki]|uniref:N-acetyltransferase domain-containing protein n=1 Tax=Polypedilum vanderplanki TaxID=319348 RepID=A0A9J6CR17_POLVA|nr:hypothetical protein PVAND_013687 [Polypedilum vanderplanki]